MQVLSAGMEEEPGRPEAGEGKLAQARRSWPGHAAWLPKSPNVTQRRDSGGGQICTLGLGPSHLPLEQ